MTAYITTPEQHAQLIKALEYSTPIAEFDDMQSEATAQIEHNTALAVLKSIKPVTPSAWMYHDGPAPDCRTCESLDEGDVCARKRRGASDCTNGDQYQPAPAVVLWRTE